MALTVSRHKCQYYSDAEQSSQSSFLTRAARRWSQAEPGAHRPIPQEGVLNAQAAREPGHRVGRSSPCATASHTWGEVRVGEDDLVAEGLETPGHKFAVGRGLDQHAGAAAKRAGSVRIPLLDDLTPIGEDTDLAFPLVDFDANWSMAGPLLLAPMSA